MNTKPIVSYIALITTIEDGVEKHGLVLYCRMSGSNSRTLNSERILLPKAWDIIGGALGMQALCVDDEPLELFVLDFSDAFYMLPLGYDEQP